MSTRKTKTVTTTTNANRRQKPRKRVRRRVKNSTQVVPTSAIHIAPCTRLYAKALTNPFAVQGLPCIPDNIVLPSHKYVTRSRGVFSTGEAGCGFVIIDPFQMAVNNGFFSNADGNAHSGGAIYYTGKNYQGSTLSVLTSGAMSTGVFVANSNSLFGYQDFDANSATDIIRTRQYRLVGCGLRVGYIGSNLYNAGRLIIFRNQSNNSINLESSITGSELLQDNYTVMTPVSRSDKYVYYVPDSTQFISYTNGSTYLPNLDGTAGAGFNSAHFSMGIYVDGGAIDPNQQSWEFEAVAFFESIGAGFTLSKSEGDPVGHDIIMSSLPNKAPTTSPASVEQSVISQFLKGFNETTREVAYNVGRRAMGMAASAAVSYMNPSSRVLALMPS